MASIYNIKRYIDLAMKRQGYEKEKQVAAEIGVARSALSSWKRRAAYPTDENMVKLAELAGVDPKLAIMDVEIGRAERRPYRKILIEMREILQAAAASIALLFAVQVMEPSEAPSLA